ncbi:MAG: LacI family DNA-binding transcriptional regulator [Thermomicrobiales bacterium]
MAKLKQVAERAGVSPATVSRVLSGAPSVTPPYRERVLRAAMELDYRPNRLASNLRRQKSATIGVVVSDIENPHFTEMVRTVEAAAFGRGFRVLLCNTDETVEKQRAYLEVLAEEQVAGVILVPSDPDGEGIARLLTMGVPLVAFDRMLADPRADAAIIANVGGARRATEYLLAAGHERIGFVGGRVDIQTGAERLAGYESAMAARGLRPRSAAGAFRIEGGLAATEALLSEDGAITALVVANNLMTIGALRALRARGLRVPNDVGLVAIDDPFWAELVDPPLTTLAQLVQRMAESAVELLFERITGGDRNQTQTKCLVFSFELRRRGSCGTVGLPQGMAETSR